MHADLIYHPLIRLVLGLLTMFAVSSILDNGMQHFGLHTYWNLYEQMVSPTSLAVLFAGTLAGAMIATRYFLASAAALYLLLSAYVVHVLHRVAENIPDAPTYLDVLAGVTLSIGLGLLILILAVVASSRIKAVL